MVLYGKKNRENFGGGKVSGGARYQLTFPDIVLVALSPSFKLFRVFKYIGGLKSTLMEFLREGTAEGAY